MGVAWLRGHGTTVPSRSSRAVHHAQLEQGRWAAHTLSASTPTAQPPWPLPPVEISTPLRWCPDAGYTDLRHHGDHGQLTDSCLGVNGSPVQIQPSRLVRASFRTQKQDGEWLMGAQHAPLQSMKPLRLRHAGDITPLVKGLPGQPKPSPTFGRTCLPVKRGDARWPADGSQCGADRPAGRPGWPGRDRRRFRWCTGPSAGPAQIGAARDQGP